MKRNIIIAIVCIIVAIFACVQLIDEERPYNEICLNHFEINQGDTLIINVNDLLTEFQNGEVEEPYKIRFVKYIDNMGCKTDCYKEFTTRKVDKYNTFTFIYNSSEPYGVYINGELEYCLIGNL